MADDPVIIYPKWQAELMAALSETNPNNLLERVKEAEKAIAKRFGRISRSTSHAAEIEAIEKAMSKRFWAISRSTSHEAEIEAIQKAMNALEVLRRKANQPKAS